MSVYQLAPADSPAGVYRSCICGATTTRLCDTGIDVGPTEQRIYLCSMCVQRAATSHSLTISEATLRDANAASTRRADELEAQLETALQSIGERDQRLTAVSALKDDAETRVNALQSAAAT